MQYNVQFSAIYDVTVDVEADSPEEAIAMVKAGGGVVVDDSFSYIHRETEFDVTELP